MATLIHPTACVSEKATLGHNVTVGPFAVVDDFVEIGDDCQLQAHAVIKPYVKMGRGNIVHSHVVLGDLPQDLSFNPDTVSWLEISDGNCFREGFTAHRATQENGATQIGSNCYFMNHSHVAHDCTIGNHTIFANNVAVGGFVDVGDRVFMGGAVVVHQFCRIGAYAIVQGTTGINKDVIPFMLIGGRPAKHYRLNTVGLRRAGITGARYKVLSTAFRRLKKKQALDDLEQTKELQYLTAWLEAKSKRGLHGFVEVGVD